MNAPIHAALPSHSKFKPEVAVKKATFKLTDKYDALLQRHITLQDENEALRKIIAAVRASATPKEAAELDSMVAENPSATDCARAVFITPSVWSRLK